MASKQKPPKKAVKKAVKKKAAKKKATGSTAARSTRGRSVDDLAAPDDADLGYGPLHPVPGDVATTAADTPAALMSYVRLTCDSETAVLLFAHGGKLWRRKVRRVTPG